MSNLKLSEPHLLVIHGIGCAFGAALTCWWAKRAEEDEERREAEAAGAAVPAPEPEPGPAASRPASRGNPARALWCIIEKPVRGDDFRTVGDIAGIEQIASGRQIRDLAKLNLEFGKGNWRKLKGRCFVEYDDGRRAFAEIHWYEAHGIGRRKAKVKREL